MRSIQNVTDQSQSRTVPLTSSGRTVAVVIACFDLQRMSLLMRAIESVCNQDYPNELTVVVDYNGELYLRVLDAVPENVSVMRNTRSRGAAGARNTAALTSDCALVAFLDDDACAKAAWLRSLVCAMDQPGVMGAGGRILPRWQEERPRWFPLEFGWVIGASIAGAGEGLSPVRNVWSGSMMVDRDAFQKVDGFGEHLSKVGGASRPEDTELRSAAQSRLRHRGDMVYGSFCAGGTLCSSPSNDSTIFREALLGRGSGKGAVANYSTRPQSRACRRKDLLE